MSKRKVKWKLIIITIINPNILGGSIKTIQERTCDNNFEKQLWSEQFDGQNVELSANTGSSNNGLPWYSQTGKHKDGTVRTFSCVSYK